MAGAKVSAHVVATRLCRGCGYDLRGLALVGKCPECGLGYDRPAQAEERAGASRHCRACWYDLKGLGERGRCSECGEAFDRVEQIAERRRADARAMTENQIWADLARRWMPSAWTVAVLIVVIGGAAVVIGFGAVALHKLDVILRTPW